MYCGIYAPWDHVPKFLRYAEVMNPLVPVMYFFDANDVEGHEEKLKTWRHFVVTDAYFNDARFGPGSLIFDYEQNVRLVEALYLLSLDRDDAPNKVNQITEEQLATERAEWVWFPVELTEKELLDPYVPIKAAFEELQLQQFRDHLSEWLNAALSIDAVDEYMSAGEIIMVYDHLKKMYSAAWLIFQRDTERTQYKDKTRRARESSDCPDGKQGELEEEETDNIDGETNDSISL
ncbi:MAG: hypothetical protein AAGC65_17245 [Mucilaginibacter sp.]|uniref:hypothetical protein n=1 Tax=Mucilaginibacter sp. TaxID=1882438 RepID=UPI0031A26BD5